MSSTTGTLAYNAPEIYSGLTYSEVVDCWSAGLILYQMLYGKLPFIVNLGCTEEAIANYKIDFSLPKYADLGKETKELLEGLLEPIPSHRLTAFEALGSKVFLPNMTGDSDISKKICQYHS